MRGRCARSSGRTGRRWRRLRRQSAERVEEEEDEVSARTRTRRREWEGDEQTHESDGVVTLEAEVEQADEGEQVADMKRASRRVDAEVDGRRRLDVLARALAVGVHRVQQDPLYEQTGRLDGPGELCEHAPLLEFVDDVAAAHGRRERAGRACWWCGSMVGADQAAQSFPREHGRRARVVGGRRGRDEDGPGLSLLRALPIACCELHYTRYLSPTLHAPTAPQQGPAVVGLRPLRPPTTSSTTALAS